MADALSSARFAERTGSTAIDWLETMSRTSQQAVEDHIQQYGRYCP